MASWHRTSRWTACWLLFGLLWLALAAPVQATTPQTPAPQGTNLLTNPGFEGSSSNQTPCDRYDGNGAYLGTVTPSEIFTPTGWRTYFRHGYPVAHNPGAPTGWSQPEVRLTTTEIDVRRIHSGIKAVMLFTFYRIHDAGFYQQVAVTPGVRYRLTGWMHSWTTDSDDPLHSSGDQYQAMQYLGIDPTGGTNPFAASVVWSHPEAHIYDVYAQPPAVEVVAQGSTLTVFLRSWVKWAVKHNDDYWDDISLVRVEHYYLPLVVAD